MARDTKEVPSPALTAFDSQMQHKRLYEQFSLEETFQLQRALLAATTLRDARHIASRLLSNQPALSFGINLAQPHWRVRLADTPFGFGAISDLLEPPADKTRAGRANHEQSPRLYLAACLETALAEVQAQEQRHYHAVAFMSSGVEDLRVAAVGEQHHVLRRGFLENFGQDPKETIKESLRGQGHERAERIAFADALLAEVIADPDARNKGYIASRGLADSLIYHANQSHGIIYPSVRHHLGRNLCIDPNIARQILKVVASHVLCVHRIWPKGYYSTTMTACHVLDKTGSGVLHHVDLRRRGPAWFNLTTDEARRIGIPHMDGD